MEWDLEIKDPRYETWVSLTGRERGTPRKPFTQAVFTEPTAKHAS